MRLLTLVAALTGMLGEAALGGPGGGKPVHFPGPPLACEFYLSGDRESASARVWLLNLMSGLDVPEAVELPDHLKPDAFTAVGLPAEPPSDLKMKIDAPRTNGGVYWLRILARGEEIQRFPFHVPPIYVWKDLEDSDEQPTLESVLFWEDQNKISAGVALGEIPSGRIFVSIRREGQRSVLVSLGIDISEKRERYTETEIPEFLSSSGHEILSRITVLRAHFNIPRRRGGPGRVTFHHHLEEPAHV